MFMKSRAFTVWTETDDAPLWNVLVVLSLTCSGRHLRCRRGAQDDIVCEVANSHPFRKGMQIRGARQKQPEQPRLWKYDGKPPRQPGRW